MDIILLPVVNCSKSPSEALKAMKEARRSAAVVVASPPQGLITSLEVRRLINSGKETLKDAVLQPLLVVFDGEFDAAVYLSLNLPESLLGRLQQHLLQTFPGLGHREFRLPVADAPSFERLMPGIPEQALIGFDRGAAVVLTRYESVAARSAGPPPDCCCINPATPHEYPASSRNGGKPCSICGQLVEC